jgi:bacterial/archaeal transporter family protein
MSWLPYALGSALFAALTAIFAKLGVTDIHSNAATFLRVLILAPVLGMVVWATGAWPNVDEISARTWLFIALSALATGASWLCYFRALQIGDVARVASIDKLSVLFAALIAAALLGEQLDARHWLGVALIVAGALLVATRA